MDLPQLESRPIHMGAYGVFIGPRRKTVMRRDDSMLCYPHAHSRP